MLRETFWGRDFLCKKEFYHMSLPLLSWWFCSVASWATPDCFIIWLMIIPYKIWSAFHLLYQQKIFPGSFFGHLTQLKSTGLVSGDSPCLDPTYPNMVVSIFTKPCVWWKNGRVFTRGVEMAAGKNCYHPIGHIWDVHTQVYIRHFHNIFCHYLLSLLFIPYIYYWFHIFSPNAFRWRKKH